MNGKPTDFTFEQVDARAYERLRPGYAPEAIRWVTWRAGVGSACTVVDLAAGTGRLARAFAALGAEIIALEPAANMRAVLAETAPGVRVLEGVAEAMPLEDERADLVVVGGAFHWFRWLDALREIHRVLRPDGALAVFANRSDPGDPVNAALDEVLSRHLDPAWPIHAAAAAWRDAFRGFQLFSQPEEVTFPTPYELPNADLGASLATSSDVASLPIDRRTALLEDLGRIAATLPPRVRIRLLTDVALCFRRQV